MITNTMYVHAYLIICTYVRNNSCKVYIFVYVIAWVAVVFGINCTSNAGRKLVIVRGAASTITVSCLHYESN